MTYKGFDNCQSLFFNSPNPYSIFEQNEIVNDIDFFSILNENISIQENPKIEIEDMNFNSIYCLENKKTKWETLKKNILFSEDKPKYKCTPLEEIKTNLMKIQNTSGIGVKLTMNNIIEDAEKKLCKIKRKRDIENNEPCILIKKENEEGEKTKRGRKIITIKKTKILHDKYSQDNIIKKIKAKLLLYAVKFFNNLLKKSNYRKKKYKLYKIDYKYIKQLKKEEDLKIFMKSLKDLFSLDISPKYKNISQLHNKNTINAIIEDKELRNYQAIMFALNLSFKEWLELFTYKKNIYEIKKHNEGFENIIEEIEKSMIYVEVLLTKILEKNDNHFLSIFTFFLYNYEEWFLIKRERTYKNTQNEQSNK